MSNLREFAIKELELLGYSMKPGQPDGPNKWVVENILELIDAFAAQGHSGSSAPYVLGLFAKLADFKPVSTLTGNDDEWMECGDGIFQNRRCFHVFKENGVAYDSEGIVFYDVMEDGGKSYFTSRDSRVPVAFPYTPKTEYMERKAKP